MREPNLPGLLSFLGEVVKMIILVKEGTDKEMRFIFGLFHFQGVDHSGCLGFHHFLSFLGFLDTFQRFFRVWSLFQGVDHSDQDSYLFRMLLILYIVFFQGVAHSRSSPPSSRRCLSWPSYSKSPPGGSSSWLSWSCWDQTDNADHADQHDDWVVPFKMLFNSQGVFVASSAVAATASFASLFSKEAIAKMD